MKGSVPRGKRQAMTKEVLGFASKALMLTLALVI